MWAEIKRKFFHLLGLVYVAGLIFLPRPTALIILGILLAVGTTFEFLRLKNTQVGLWFNQTFGGLLREAEQTKLSGVFWMALGVFATALVAEPLPIAVAALLYLILGDGVASLAGMRFGGPHWPGSNRRLSGSLACFLVCLFVGVVILKPHYDWPTVLVGAAAATLLEKGVLPFNDNFTIPVGSALALLLSSRFLS